MSLTFLQIVYVKELLYFMERSIDWADRIETSFKIFKASIHKNRKMFRSGLWIAFENFSIEKCNNAKSNSSNKEVIHFVYSFLNENIFAYYHNFNLQCKRGRRKELRKQFIRAKAHNKRLNPGYR